MSFTKDEQKMLLDLFHVYGPSHGEEPVLNFIKDVLTQHNIPFKQDDNGNIYCLNHKNQPLLSAHTDCVGKAEAGHYVHMIDLYPYGDDLILKGVGNIGGDDKCGVFLILLYLISDRPINAVFSICEEIGGADGIQTWVQEVKDDKIFKSCPYTLVLDRRSKGDIICFNNQYGSKRFEEELTKIGENFGYTPATGSCSDANTLRNYMNSCNLSVAYYNAHSNTEFVSLNELYNTWEYIQELIDRMPRDIPLERPQPVVWNSNYNSNYKSMSTYGWID